MSGTVIILGANGRFGRAAVDAFNKSGWKVRAFARSWAIDAAQDSATGVERVTGDAFDENDVAQASMGCDVIINALNPPYPRWRQDLPRLTNSVIYGAKKSGATVMIPGNVYNYGAEMPENLTENTDHNPTSHKGRLRMEMEETYRQSGIQTILLRAGDYFEQQKTGDWFGSHITANLDKGHVMYPAKLDQVHAWAYLPDLARAMAALALKRQYFKPFEEFGFPGYGVTGQQLVDVMEENLGHKLKIKNMPWRLIRVLGLILPQMREVAEMSYLWQVPHRIDGSKLATILPDFKVTPLKNAIAQSI
ncbi:MAG: NAD(P)H-binding protein [Sneathiella sp.]